MATHAAGAAAWGAEAAAWNAEDAGEAALAAVDAIRDVRAAIEAASKVDILMAQYLAFLHILRGLGSVSLVGAEDQEGIGGMSGNTWSDSQRHADGETQDIILAPVKYESIE